MDYFFVLKDLLLKSYIPPKNICLLTDNGLWNEFLESVINNRLSSYLYRFLASKKQQLRIPAYILKEVFFTYQKALIIRRNYQKVKIRLKECIKKMSTPLILTKDLDKDKMFSDKLPYLPIKFDIDILGRYKDLEKFQKFIDKIGYSPSNHPYGWPKELIPQYKFCYKEKYKFYPQIEFRFQAITIPVTNKMPILNKEDIERFTQELWQNAKIKEDNFAELPREYFFLHYCLIYYFEDGCKGLNNLYRIWLFVKEEGKRLNWDKIWYMAERYQVTNIITLVLLLMEREFPKVKLKGNFVKMKNNIYIQLVLKIFDLEYICRTFLPTNKKAFWRRKDGYVHFLTRGLLADVQIGQKLTFFFHPKRLLILALSLGKII